MRHAWQQVDHYTHVNQFSPLAELQLAWEAAALTVETHRQEMVLEYAELRQLTHELKALGAHNMNAGQSSGLTGRARVAAFRDAYEAQRNSAGLLPATYEVFYLHGRKPG